MFMILISFVSLISPIEIDRYIDESLKLNCLLSFKKRYLRWPKSMCLLMTADQ